MEKVRLQPILYGFIGTLGLLTLYFLTMRSLSNSWEATIFQFKKLWPFMILLSLGFGTQIGLYFYVKKHISKKMMAANTTVSAIGMIACCAHHVTDVLPIFGLSLATVFLIKFQIPILLLGIFSNIIGIIYLLTKLRNKNI